MPAYTRLIEDSLAASLNDGKVFGLCPKGISVSSVKEKLSPSKIVSTAAAAFEVTECPLVNSGKGGVCIIGSHFSSMILLITVIGLMRFVLYFSSQQAIKAS